MNRTTVAQQAKTATLLSPTQGILQRKCACGNYTVAGGKCAGCSDKHLTLQRHAINPAELSNVPIIVQEVLESPSQKLDAATRAFMEPRFGYDFSGVRVHSDAKAAESARVVNALAYTVGPNIVFGTRQYEPGVMVGQRLIAHELTHVMQQSRGEGKAVASSDDTKLHAFPQAATPSRSSLRSL